MVTLSASAAVYRWVDDQGVAHYSDSPRPDSNDADTESIDLPTANVVQSVIPPTGSRARSNAPAGEDGQLTNAYQSLRIVSPSMSETLWNIGGELQVIIRIDPKLKPGHGVFIYLDDLVLTTRPIAASAIVIDNVHRGEHSIRAAVHDANGSVLIGSEPVTFYVQQSRAN